MIWLLKASIGMAISSAVDWRTSRAATRLRIEGTGSALTYSNRRPQLALMLALRGSSRRCAARAHAAADVDIAGQTM